ncbi:MAG: kinase [Chloroflexi bacterium]|nr:kinase [Chloroflexota bacterium]MBT4072991.1 kinase [Chloroflexota bacterium]MBT4516004.1 kinase [Chloroflexota bacterium]MBT6680763.1 kinase [Chloroflexota bacterium]
MIITRTPYRISFFGGGTDYPVWWKENGGAVLAATINRYCYITCTPRLPFYDFKYLVSWSENETVNEIDEIVHPSVRECLRYLNVNHGMDVRTAGELPARAGLGASSAFTVGLLHALYRLRGVSPSPVQLAIESTHVEQDMIGENVGSQDQAMAAIGGLNKIRFNRDGTLGVDPIHLSTERSAQLQSNLMLAFTGITRRASQVAESQIEETLKGNLSDRLTTMQEMVDEGAKVLSSGSDLDDFGRLLHEGWQLKRSLTSAITNSEIDDLYEGARKLGAVGGKITGAGGGGFMLLYASPEAQARIRERYSNLIHVDVAFESQGSRVVFEDIEASNSALRGFNDR